MYRSTSNACSRCGPNAVLSPPKPGRICSVGSAWPTYSSHPIAVRLRTYQVKLPAVDQAYVETLYQWPAFKAWQKAGLEELSVKRVHVAAAVIRDNSGKILIARRADTQHQGGLWEFPGGKVEADESVETALARELHEELGIVVGAARPLIKVRHDYPDKQVLLDVWEVSAFHRRAARRRRPAIGLGQRP
jgi:mutator protein MutT